MLVYDLKIWIRTISNLLSKLNGPIKKMDSIINLKHLLIK